VVTDVNLPRVRGYVRKSELAWGTSGLKMNKMSRVRGGTASNDTSLKSKLYY